MSELVYSQTFEEGYQSYMRNQFPVAELQFRRALTKAKTKEDRAFLLKFTGICQYMRGDKKAAATTFNSALAADKNVAISGEEVLDPAVVTLFNALKTKYLAAARTVAKPAPPLPQSKSVAQELPLAKPPAAAPLPPDRTKKKKKPAADAPVKTEENLQNYSYFHFMPFGIGQFHNGSYLLGSIFAGGEFFSLYRYQIFGRRVKEELAQNNEVENNPKITDRAEKDAFLAENSRFISTLNRDKQAVAVSFLALWAVGVTEAIISSPRTRPDDSRRTEEASAMLTTPSIQTAWLPNRPGGTYLLQLRLQID